MRNKVRVTCNICSWTKMAWRPKMSLARHISAMHPKAKMWNPEKIRSGNTVRNDALEELVFLLGMLDFLNFPVRNIDNGTEFSYSAKQVAELQIHRLKLIDFLRQPDKS